MRGVILIVVALFIDGLQAAMSLMFFVLGASLTLIPFAGVAGAPIGVGLGVAINFCLSATLGTGLIMLLIFNKMFYPRYVLPGGITEIFPGFSLVPTWTAIVILSILRKKKEELTHAAPQAVSKTVTTTIQRPADTPEIPARQVDGIQAPTANNDNTRVPLTKRYAA